MRLQHVLLIGAALAAPVAFAAGVAGQAYVPPIASIDELPLPDHPGRETVFFTCTACHGVGTISQQRLSRERWDEVVTEMITVNGLYPPTETDRQLILDYLAAAFPEGPAPAGAYTNPFL